VVHGGQGLLLRAKAGHDLLAVHAQLHDLEGHPPQDRLALLRGVDHGHAALAQSRQQPIGADHVRHVLRQQGRGQPAQGFPLGAPIRRQKPLDPGAKLRITGAGLVQVSVPLGRRHLQATVEHVLFALVANGLHGFTP
jgi:hypothetical protein